MSPIRIAQPADLPEIVAIYNAAIPGRMATADTEPVTVAARESGSANSIRRAVRCGCLLTRRRGVAGLAVAALVLWPAGLRGDGRSWASTPHPAAQRRGIARSLLAHALAAAPALRNPTLLAFVFAHNAPVDRAVRSAPVSPPGDGCRASPNSTASSATSRSSARTDPMTAPRRSKSARRSPTDVPAVHAMIGALADYEKLAHLHVATEADLAASLFGPRPAAEVLIACKNGNPAAFALFFHNFSTFLGRRGSGSRTFSCCPPTAGRAARKALLRALAGIARERGCGRFEWAVLDWNASAIEFYDAGRHGPARLADRPRGRQRAGRAGGGRRRRGASRRAARSGDNPRDFAPPCARAAPAGASSSTDSDPDARRRPLHPCPTCRPHAFRPRRRLLVAALGRRGERVLSPCARTSRCRSAPCTRPRRDGHRLCRRRLRLRRDRRHRRRPASRRRSSARPRWARATAKFALIDSRTLPRPAPRGEYASPSLAAPLRSRRDWYDLLMRESRAAPADPRIVDWEARRSTS